MSLIDPFLKQCPSLLKVLEEILGSREKTRRQLSWLCRPLADLHPSAWAGGKIANPDPDIVRNIHIWPIDAPRLGSYTKLPDRYPPIISTGRYDTLRKEINDQWVTVAKGSEDFSFKVMRRNVFEDALFKCEDERFEIDIAINNFSTTIKFLEQIQADALEANNRGER